MNDLIELLNIDNRCLIDKRITKIAISNNSTLNASEKKILKEVIIDIRWLASYKPFNSAIPEYITKTECYDEVQIISIGFSDIKYKKQVINILQRSMPYPLVLLLEVNNNFAVSVARKSINQTDNLKRTIDEVITSTWLNKAIESEVEKSFLEHLNTKTYHTLHLKAFYESFIKAIYLHETSLLTGSFNVKEKKEVDEDADILKEIEAVNKEIVSIKSQIKKGTIFSNKVTLNIKLKAKENHKQKLIKKLS
ncbi:uncharacterized protein DUF4391 [Lutibacter oceani]|uniref:Uncharacterized protein DUF4391 n=1 Tax=Lutibacter oceani TaxID=1853311 RepID=A0A3D9RVL0_9FLAO|nr:DUF4391 domain-containing protein [Lutibacter oceani]REE80682.1 uncharacterized protein DUF4391 [Lutibacter oceani]